MLQTLTTFLLSFCILGITACNAQSAPKVEENNRLATDGEIPSSSQDCEEWNRTYALLSNEGKEDVQKEGIALNGRDESSSRAYYVLSPELVDDCNLRVKIGQFIQLVVGGTDTETDKQFAEQNSEQTVRVLRHIWNSPAFSYDGVSHEKYLLLINKGINDKNVAPFIGELVEREGLNSELFYVLRGNTFSSVRPKLLKSLEKAESTQDLLQQVYALVLLQENAFEPKLFSKLNKIAQEEKNSENNRKSVSKIARKIKARKAITSDDIEGFEIAIDESLETTPSDGDK